jgi:hypothetical protein
MNSNLDQKMTDTLRLDLLDNGDLEALRQAVIDHPWISLAASFAVGLGIGTQISTRAAKTLGLFGAQMGWALLNHKNG